MKLGEIPIRRRDRPPTEKPHIFVFDGMWFAVIGGQVTPIQPNVRWKHYPKGSLFHIIRRCFEPWATI